MKSHGSIMAGIDKAAIVFSIAITLVGVGIAVMGSSADYSPAATPTSVAPTMMKTEEPKTQTDPFADLADKVREKASMDDKEDTMMKMDDKEDTMMKMDDKEASMDDDAESMESSGPMTYIVDIPQGTSVPGCEKDDTCFLPADITINAGDTVEWINLDTAAHTVTSGNLADGPSDVFDSSLVMADAIYAFTFEDAGSYDYFCIVHPWMTGTVTVN